MKATLKVTRVATIPEIERLVPVWERIATQDVREGFFRSPCWYLTWIRYIRPDVSPMVLVVRDQEEIVAIAPLSCGRTRSRLRILSLAGNDLVCGEYLDFPSLPGYRQLALESIWAELLGGELEWDLLSLSAMRTEGDLFWEAHKRAQADGLMLRSEERICPFVQLPTTFEEYLARFSKRRRKHFVRTRRIFKDHGAEVKIYRSGPELESAIPRLIDLHCARWKTVGKPGTLGQPGFAEFLLTLGRKQASEGAVRLYTLEVGGLAKAAMLNFHFGTSAFQFQNGFDPAWKLAKHSPGTVLILHGIETAVAEGCHVYDFLRGAEEYKFHFADRSKPITDVRLARTLRGKLFLCAASVRPCLARLRPRRRGPAAREWIFLPR